jgi:hypothetical protein
MYKRLKVWATLIIICAFLTGGVLLALQISAPDGNIGDEGLAAIPFLLVLAGLMMIGALMSIVFLISERPKGKLLILPFSIILMTVIPLVVLVAYGKNHAKNYGQHWNDISISKAEALDLVHNCQVSEIDYYYPQHPALKIKGSYDEKYIFQSDLSDIDKELNLAKSTCKVITQ